MIMFCWFFTVCTILSQRFMTLQVHTKGIDLTEGEREYAEEKAGKILHMSKKAENDESVRVRIEIDKESGKEKTAQFSSSFTVSLPGKTLRGQAEGPGVLAVIDEAYDRVRKQMRKETTTHKHI